MAVTPVTDYGENSGDCAKFLGPKHRRTLDQELARSRLKNILVGVAAFVVIGLILWLDITTGIWADLAVVSGLAGGLVSFLLTVTVLDRLVARAAARRWAPVNRLALVEFLNSIADDEHSEISRGLIVPRKLPQLDESSVNLSKDLHTLRERVLRERALLSEALGTWAQFLASSGDNTFVMRHVAEFALQLERVRDAALDAEDSRSEAGAAVTGKEFVLLNEQIDRCNAAMVTLESELRTQITLEDEAAISQVIASTPRAATKSRKA